MFLNSSGNVVIMLSLKSSPVNKRWNFFYFTKKRIENQIYRVYLCIRGTFLVIKGAVPTEPIYLSVYTATPSYKYSDQRACLCKLV